MDKIEGVGHPTTGNDIWTIYTFTSLFINCENQQPEDISRSNDTKRCFSPYISNGHDEQIVALAKPHQTNHKLRANDNWVLINDLISVLWQHNLSSKPIPLKCAKIQKCITEIFRMPSYDNQTLFLDGKLMIFYEGHLSSTNQYNKCIMYT